MAIDKLAFARNQDGTRPPNLPRGVVPAFTYPVSEARECFDLLNEDVARGMEFREASSDDPNRIVIEGEGEVELRVDTLPSVIRGRILNVVTGLEGPAFSHFYSVLDQCAKSADTWALVSPKNPRGEFTPDGVTGWMRVEQDLMTGLNGKFLDFQRRATASQTPGLRRRLQSILPTDTLVSRLELLSESMQSNEALVPEDVALKIFGRHLSLHEFSREDFDQITAALEAIFSNETELRGITKEGISRGIYLLARLGYVRVSEDEAGRVDMVLTSPLLRTAMKPGEEVLREGTKKPHLATGL